MQKSSLAFASIMLAVFALFAIVNLNTFAPNYEVAYDSTEAYESSSTQNQEQSKSVCFLSNRVSAAAVLETRRQNRQTHFRPLRGSTIQGFCSRDSQIFDKLGSLATKVQLLHNRKISGYPSPAFFCTAKDYYVYTLKRQLC